MRYSSLGSHKIVSYHTSLNCLRHINAFFFPSLKRVSYSFTVISYEDIKIQSNLEIRNFLVTLKLFLNAKCSLPSWSKLTIGDEKWFLNTSLLLIKTSLITKFDCTILKKRIFFLSFLYKQWVQNSLKVVHHSTNHRRPGFNMVYKPI